MPYVLIVDDEADLAGLVEFNLRAAGLETAVAGSGGTALELAAARKPDLILLDLMLPDISGKEVARRVRASPQLAAVPIIMLTARGDVMDHVVGLELGAYDYLPKPFEPRELVARMQAVLRRGAPAAGEERVRAGALELNWTTCAVRLHGQLLALTSAEFELLGLLLRNRGHVLTRERIMDEIRGIDWEAYDRSIDVLVSRLRQKLSDDPRQPRFIRTVRGVGYSFIGGDDDA